MVIRHTKTKVPENYRAVLYSAKTSQNLSDLQSPSYKFCELEGIHKHHQKHTSNF
jgi:hypothetical protein